MKLGDLRTEELGPQRSLITQRCSLEANDLQSTRRALELHFPGGRGAPEGDCVRRRGRDSVAARMWRRARRACPAQRKTPGRLCQLRLNSAGGRLVCRVILMENHPPQEAPSSALFSSSLPIPGTVTLVYEPLLGWKGFESGMSCMYSGGDRASSSYL